MSCFGGAGAMKIFAFLFVLFLFHGGSVSVPLVNDVNSNDIDDIPDGAVVDDDLTTHGLERLSSAATCLVAGVEYTHGQQIYRADPCEFCLCLDGEMFCWWQDCPPTMEGPCRDRGPFSPCDTAPAAPPTTGMASRNLLDPSSSTVYTESDDNSTETTSILADTPAEDGNASSTEMAPNCDTTEHPNTCLVMGREYQIGDKLPHDTGNCVECICGPGAKVSCSPHQCVPVGEEMADYRSPDGRQQVPDAF